MAKRRRRTGTFVFFNRRRLKQLVALLFMLAVGLGGSLFLRGRIVSVADGDTLTVFTQAGERQRIRLYGIDCPESLQAGGREAADFVRSHVLFAEAEIEVIDKDRYGRAVALVTLPDGRLLNEELVGNGHAWVYDNYCRIPLCAKWRVLEKEARAARKGLWADKNPMPPWGWRRTNQ